MFDKIRNMMFHKTEVKNPVGNGHRVIEKDKGPEEQVTIGEYVFPDKGFKKYSDFGKRMSKIYIKASDSKDLPAGMYTKNNILRDGLVTILENPDTTREEKFLAKLGIESGKKVDFLGNDTDAYGLMYGCIKAIQGRVNGPIGAVISKLIYNAIDNSDDNSRYAGGKQCLLEKGFEIILASPDSNEKVKSIAKVALDSKLGNFELDKEFMRNIIAEY